MRAFGLTLGNWRTASTAPSGLLGTHGVEATPGVYVLSARCCGMKGAFPGSRHTWLSIFFKGEWTTIELTDEETLSLQATPDGARAAWTPYGRPSALNRHHAPFRSNRTPDAHWFGQAPRLECMVASELLANYLMSNLDKYCTDYCFRHLSNMLDNNCSKLVSYLLWRIAGSTLQENPLRPRSKFLIGYRQPSYWNALYGSAQWQAAPMRAPR
jgi:hypothetical protein